LYGEEVQVLLKMIFDHLKTISIFRKEGKIIPEIFSVDFHSQYKLCFDVTKKVYPF